MRKIKFRCWDIVNKKMRSDKDLWDITYNEIFIHTPDQRALNIMQYTGLKDINGTEIYEGDIIKIQSMVHDNYPVYVGKVVFENGAYMCNSKWNTHWIGDMFLSKEILGNIYENPELLEEDR